MFFVGLRGPDVGSEFLDKSKNPTTTIPFGNDLLVQIKVSPEAVWGVLEPGFCTLRDKINEVVLSKLNADLDQL